MGQDHLVGENAPLSSAILNKKAFSFILWGPPGSGKTTLARIYARSLGFELFELSAVSAGKADIRKIVSSGRVENPPVLFLDEIHRFNKSQQDFLLPYVESGQLLLIGATTENPSFEVIPALLSRCQVFVLNSLSEDELRGILKRTEFDISKEAEEWLVNYANGDARRILSALENTYELYGSINIDNLTSASQKVIRYDKAGDEHYDTISAFIKSMRASQPNSALYYLARMIKAGEDPKFIARRMVIFASEDIGMAQPTALVVANEVFRAIETVGLPEAGINLAHGVVYLAEAKKDRSSYDGYNKAMDEVEKSGNLSIPKKIRNAVTSLMKKEGYGEGYEKYTDDDLLPDKIKGKKFYKRKKQ